MVPWSAFSAPVATTIVSEVMTVSQVLLFKHLLTSILVRQRLLTMDTETGTQMDLNTWQEMIFQ
jgi:hypothetical protein